MTESNYSTIILVNQSPLEVFNAINNVRGWWQGEIEGTANQLNSEFSYRMEGFHFSKQKVLELVPNEKIVWLVTDSKLTFTENQTEWTGTTIMFEITQVNNQTQIRFTHVGLVPEFECYEACSRGWKELIHKSLTSLIKTGKGIEVF